MEEKRENVANVPNLRFPGFEGEWEYKKVDDIAIKVNSGKTPLGGQAAYTVDGVLFIRSQNVNNGQLELDYPTFISEKTNSQMKNSIVKSDDILLNITGASLGRSCVVPQNFTIGNVNQHVCIIRLKNEYSPRFIQSIFASDKGQNIFGSLQTGSGREGLNFESIKSIKLPIPSSSEQNKIAALISLIENRIQTQSKIIEDLKALSQSLIQQIFTRNLTFQNIGEIEWTTKNISEVLTIGSGRDYKHLNTGNIPVFGTGGYMTSVDEFLHDGETVCVGRKGTIDKPMYYNGKIWTVDTLFYTHSFEGVLPKFIFYAFQLINWKGYNEASGVPSLSKSTIEKIEIDIPPMTIQYKIIETLSVVDQKVDNETKILSKMRDQKSYLLKSLFI